MADLFHPINCKELKILYHIEKENSQWISDLNVRHETIKVPEENIVNKLLDTSFSNIFLNMSQGR